MFIKPVLLYVWVTHRHYILHLNYFAFWNNKWGEETTENYCIQRDLIFTQPKIPLETIIIFGIFTRTSHYAEPLHHNDLYLIFSYNREYYLQHWLIFLFQVCKFSKYDIIKNELPDGSELKSNYSDTVWSWAADVITAPALATLTVTPLCHVELFQFFQNQNWNSAVTSSAHADYLFLFFFFLPVWLCLCEHCFARAKQTLNNFPAVTSLTTPDMTWFSKETLKIKIWWLKTSH